MQQPGSTSDTEARIKLQEQQLAMLQEENRQLRQAWQASQQAGGAAANYSLETPTTPPSLFDGTLGECRRFILQCQHTFDLRPGMTNKHKVLFIVGLLRGRALEWAQAEDLRNPLASRTLTGFLRDFRSVFDLPHDQGTVTERILQIRQGGESVADYSIRFKNVIPARAAGRSAPAPREAVARWRTPPPQA